MAAVSARGVSKRFDTTRALDGVDLTVQEGEVRGLLGPNGAGKTTLLRILFGLVAADSGSIELFDRRVGAQGPLRLDGVSGFVEDPSFYPYLSGRANLELLAELDGDGAHARIGAVLERVGLSQRAEERVSGYSTGMRQRLGIAASLLRAPRLLLLDEPTSGLDPGGVREIGALVREISDDGVAVVLSSHQIGEIEGVCHAFTFLRSGQVVWDGSAAQLRAHAPSSSYRLQTSDDPRALEIARRRLIPGAAPDNLTARINTQKVASGLTHRANDVRRAPLVESMPATRGRTAPVAAAVAIRHRRTEFHEQGGRRRQRKRHGSTAAA